MKKTLNCTTCCVALLCMLLGPALAVADETTELLDRLQIMELQSRYALAHDLTDPAQYAAVFSEDAELVSGDRVLAKGRDAFYNIAVNDRKRYNNDAPMDERSFGVMRHVVTNSVIDLTGPDTAKGLCYVMTIANLKDYGPAILSIGRYEDEFRKVDGKWYISRREIAMDWGNNELAAQVFGP